MGELQVSEVVYFILNLKNTHDKHVQDPNPSNFNNWQHTMCVCLMLPTLFNSPEGQRSLSYRHHNSGSEEVWAAAWAEAACSEREVSWWKCSLSMLLLLLQLPLPASAAVAAGSSWRLRSKLLPRSLNMRFLGINQDQFSRTKVIHFVLLKGCMIM